MTQSHIAIGLPLAAKSGRRAAIAGAILGGITPDFMMVPMVLISSFVLGQDMGQSWSPTYYGVPWWNIDQIANSGPLYALLAGVAALAMRQTQHWWPRFLLAFSITALLHVGFDFLTHATDGHIHFWPFSDFVFASPVSYWESAHHGRLLTMRIHAWMNRAVQSQVHSEFTTLMIGGAGSCNGRSAGKKYA